MEARDFIKSLLKEEGVILPKELVVKLYSEILKFAGGLSGLIQATSTIAGKSIANIFKEKLHNYNLIEIAELFFDETGLGKIKIEKLENGYKITILDTFLLKAHNKPELCLKPLQGATEGFFEVLENVDYSSRLEGTSIILEKKGKPKC
ncbi:MAG: hypothetical protein ABIL37_02525 [candidate division WOR-3 bacterium]